MLEKMNLPVVFCSFSSRHKKIVVEAGFKEVSLNKLLAETLLKIEPNTRTQFVFDEVMKIVIATQAPVFLTDYEMLFDPRYNIDVIKLFCEMSRRVKIVIKWCGTLQDNRLVYATPAYKDFHSYNIYDYDIICVI